MALSETYSYKSTGSLIFEIKRIQDTLSNHFCKLQTSYLPDLEISPESFEITQLDSLFDSPSIHQILSTLLDVIIASPNSLDILPDDFHRFIFQFISNGEFIQLIFAILPIYIDNYSNFLCLIYEARDSGHFNDLCNYINSCINVQSFIPDTIQQLLYFIFKILQAFEDEGMIFLETTGLLSIIIKNQQFISYSYFIEILTKIAQISKDYLIIPREIINCFWNIFTYKHYHSMFSSICTFFSKAFLHNNENALALIPSNFNEMLTPIFKIQSNTNVYVIRFLSCLIQNTRIDKELLVLEVLNILVQIGEEITYVEKIEAIKCICLSLQLYYDESFMIDWVIKMDSLDFMVDSLQYNFEVSDLIIDTLITITNYSLLSEEEGTVYIDLMSRSQELINYLIEMQDYGDSISASFECIDYILDNLISPD